MHLCHKKRRTLAPAGRDPQSQDAQSTHQNESFCFFLQKEALAFILRAAAPPTPRARF
jgi:hypothetical protein